MYTSANGPQWQQEAKHDMQHARTELANMMRILKLLAILPHPVLSENNPALCLIPTEDPYYAAHLRGGGKERAGGKAGRETVLRDGLRGPLGRSPSDNNDAES